MNNINHTRVEKHNLRQLSHFGHFSRSIMNPVSSPYIDRQIQKMIEFGELRPEERLLEVGCGMGRYTIPLAEKGFTVSGLDLTPELLERLREFNADRFDIPLYCYDILDAPDELRDEYDAIIGFFTLHHLHDLQKSFTAMVKLVKPGGRIIFLEPNAFNPLYYIQITCTPGMSWKADKGVIRMHSGPVLGAMKSAGLTDLSIDQFGAFPPYITNHALGSRIEDLLERLSLLDPIRPFQLFKGIRGAN